MTTSTEGRRFDDRPEQYKRNGMWVIYESPSDYPGKFVARWWEYDTRYHREVSYTATTEKHLTDTLEEARAKIGAGFACFPRHPSDDPVIVEVWL